MIILRKYIVEDVKQELNGLLETFKQGKQPTVEELETAKNGRGSLVVEGKKTLEELKKNPEENKEQIAKMEEAIKQLESCSKCVDDHAKANKEEEQKKKQEATAKAGHHRYEIYNVYAIAVAECKLEDEVKNAVNAADVMNKNRNILDFSVLSIEDYIDYIPSGLLDLSDAIKADIIDQPIKQIPITDDDGDVFDEKGYIISKSRNGSNIYVEVPCALIYLYCNIQKPCKDNTEKIRYNFRELDLNLFNSNVAVANILKYYGIQEGIDFSKGGNLYIVQSDKKVVAYTDDQNIIFVKQGINNKQLDDILATSKEVRSMLYHENLHKQNNFKGIKSNYFNHSEVYKNQILQDNFWQCSNEFKKQVWINFCTYLLNYQYNPNDNPVNANLNETVGDEGLFRSKRISNMLNEVNKKWKLQLQYDYKGIQAEDKSCIIESIIFPNQKILYQELKNPE